MSDTPGQIPTRLPAYRFDPDALRRAREAADLTQADLAEAIGYSPQAVSGWERGRSVPDANALVGMADHLGVHLDHLYMEVPW